MPSFHGFRFWVAIVMIALSSESRAESGYDPLRGDSQREPEIHDLIVKDTLRHREIPLRVYLPESKTAAPVVLFSHGLGGSREGNPYLGKHWSNRGYVVVCMQHLGSDASVWKDVPLAKRLDALKEAANLQNTLLRFKDVRVVIDQLTQWNQSSDSLLNGRMDMSKIGMSGHSFGAVTTQAVAGQRTPLGKAAFTDERIKAAVIMSQAAPKNGDPKKLFGGVAIPWLMMTGTADVAIVGDADVESRLAVFPALPPGGKYELVLKDGEHEAFSDRDLPGSKKSRNPNHHRVILALSTAFWDGYLNNDVQAKAWLDGQGPSSVLETGDRWQKK